MANQKRINVTVGFMTDKASLDSLENSLLNIARSANEPAKTMNQSYQQAAQTAQHLLDILNKSYSKDIGAVNVSKFAQELKKANLSAETIRDSLKGAGRDGATAFNQLGSQILGTNLKLKETNKLLDSMATSMANTIKWGITSSIFNTVTNSIQKAYDYSVDLNTSLNNIRIVTSKSKEEMQSFAIAANEAAKGLGANTLAYTDAALIYYQQGLGNAEAQARAETTIKAANVTGTSAQQMSEYLTAVWNGYKVSASEAELYVDKLSAVAATTAADLEELSTGMSKVASAANSMGVDIDQLNAQLATIVSVTRQAPESVGTALKTIYARMTDIETGITEDGVTLGTYTEDMAEMGINVLNASGQLRDMGEVIEEIGGKWTSYSREQQIAMAQVMAGTRQYNNLIALFDNWGDYEDTLKVSKNALGSLQAQQDIYMESTEAKLQELKATWQDLYGSLIDNDTLNGAIEGITNLIETFDKFIDSFGGGTNAVTAFGILIANIFNKQITGAISNGIKRFTQYTQNIDTLRAKMDFAEQEAIKAQKGGSSEKYLKAVGEQANYEAQLKYAKDIMKIQNAISQDKYNELTAMQKELGLLEQKKAILEQQQQLELEGVFGKDRIKEILGKTNDPDELEAIQTFYGEQIAQDDTLLNILDEQKSKIQDIINLKRQGQNIDNEERKIESILIEIQKKLSEEEAKALITEKEQLKLLDKEERDYSKIYKIIEDIEKKKQNSAKQTKKEADAINKVYLARVQEAEILNDINQKAKDFNTTFDEEKLTARVNNVVTAVTSLSSSLVSLWGGINSLFSIWNDESMSSGDKIAQTVSTLTFLLPTLISSLEKLNSLRGVSSSLLDVIIAKKQAKIAWDAAEVKGTIALTAEKKLAVLWENLLTEAKIKGIVASEATVASLTKEQKAQILSTLSASKYAKAIKAIQTAMSTLSKSLLKNPWTWFIAFIAAAITALTKYNKKLEETRKKQQENLEYSRQQNAKYMEETKKEIDLNNQLAESMLNLYKNYQIGITAREEVVSALSDLLKSYELEYDELNDLIDNYSLLIKIIKEGKIKDATKGYVAYDTVVQDELEKIQDNFQKSGKDSLSDQTKDNQRFKFKVDNLNTGFGTLRFYLGDTVGAGADSPLGQEILYRLDDYEVFKNLHIKPELKIYEKPKPPSIDLLRENPYAYHQQQAEYLESIKHPQDSPFYFDITLTKEQYPEAISALEEIVQDIVTGEDGKKYQNDILYKEIGSFIQTQKEDLKNYYEASEGKAEAYKDQLMFGLKIGEFDNQDFSYQQFFKQRSIFLDILGVSENFQGEPLFKDMDAIVKSVDETYKELHGANLKVNIADYLARANAVDRYLEDLYNVENSYQIEDEDLRKKVSASREILSGASLKALQLLNSNHELFQADENILLEDLQSLVNKANLKTDHQTLKESSQILSEIIIALEDNKELDEDQTKFLNSKLKELYPTYEGLYPVFDRLDEPQSEKQYLERLKTLEDDLQQRAASAGYEYWSILQESFLADFYSEEDNYWKINSQNIDDFEKRLREIEEASYEIHITFDETTKASFDEMTRYLDELHTGIQFIQEGFKVDADKVQDLNAIFPGILEGAVDLKNGLVQLDKERLAIVLKTYKEEETAKINAAITEIELRQEQLREQKKFAMKQSEYAEQMSSEEAQDNVAKLAAYKLLLSKQAALKQEMEEVLGTETEELNEDQNDQFIKNDQKKVEAYVENNLKGQERIIEGQKILNDFQSGAITYEDAKQQFKGLRNISLDDYTPAEDLIPEDPFDPEGFYTSIVDHLTKFMGNFLTSEEISEEAGEITEEYSTVDNGLDEISWIDIQQGWNDVAESFAELEIELDGRRLELIARRSELFDRYNNVLAGLGGKSSSELSGDEKDRLDDLEKLFTKYHDIEVKLKQIEAELEKVHQAQDKAFGVNLLKEYNKELDLLNQRIALNNEKLEIATKTDLMDRQTILLGYGLEFSKEDNTITNYEDWYLKRYQEVQDLINNFNQNRTEENQKLVEDAQDQFDKELELIEAYEELLLETIPEIRNQIQEDINTQIERQITKFHTEVDLHFDLSETTRDWNEFEKTVLNKIKDDDILGNALADLKNFETYYAEDRYGSIQATTLHLEDILGELAILDQGINSKIYGDNQKQAYEDMLTYFERLKDEMLGLYELSEQIRESYVKMMNEAQDKFDEQIEEYEQITSIIEHDMRVIQLIGGEDSYAELAKYYESQRINHNEQLEFQRQQIAFWENQMTLAGEGTEAWDTAKNNWMAAVSDWTSLVETAIENVENKFVNAIEEIFQKLNSEVTSGKGLEYISEEWELINKNADQYLDKVNTLYGIQDVKNKYLNAIEETDNVATQQKLNSLMEAEVAALKAKDKLTQYDVDRALKKYEITMKQIALEEAQQNKTSMRLKRDSQGNYSYQFVANEDDIGKTEEELAALRNELYNFDLEHYRDNLDQLYSAWEEYQEKMKEAAQINDPEERKERELLLNKHYEELINGIVKENEVLRGNLRESAFDELEMLQKDAAQGYKDLSNEAKNNLLAEMVPQWTSGVQQMKEVFAEKGGFVPTCQTAMDELKAVTQTYQEDLKTLETNAGFTYKTLAEGIDKNIGKTHNLLEKNQELIDKYDEEIGKIRAVVLELDQLIEKYEDAYDAAEKAAKAAYRYQQMQTDYTGEAYFEDIDYSLLMSNLAKAYKSQGKGPKLFNDLYYQTLSDRREAKRESDGSYSAISSDTLRDIFKLYNRGDEAATKLVEDVIAGKVSYTYDTIRDYGVLVSMNPRPSGVTTKEPQVTTDVLPPIDIASAMDSNYGTLISKILDTGEKIVSTVTGILTGTPSHSQIVNVEANFPNVTNHLEVEEALNNLPNTASQRVSQNGK